MTANMDSWKNIKITGIGSIEKCVAEFNIWEQDYSHSGKFKIKIFENAEGKFIGYSNLHVKDELGDFYCAVGYGDSIENALKDTLNYFYQMVSRKKPEEWSAADFSCANSVDF